MNEDKATRYHRLRRRAAVLSVVVVGAFLTGSVWVGLSHAVRDETASWTRAPVVPAFIQPAVHVVLFAGVLGIACELMLLPLALYRGSMLDRRYGLSSESAGAWLWARTKLVAVSVIALAAGALGLQVVAAVSLRGWWLGAAGLCALAMLTAARLIPDILPSVLGELRPVDRQPLADRLTVLAQRAGLGGIVPHEWNGVDASRANAAIVGIGGPRRVLLSRALLRDCSDEEVEVVFAHELAHYVHRDVWRTLAIDVASIFGAFAAADWILTRVRVIAYLEGPRDLAALPLLMGVVGGFWLARLPLRHALSRRLEQRADAFALRLTGRHEAFLKAVHRLAAQHLSEERPSRLVELLFHTHPPPARRIAATRSLETTRGF